MSRINGNGLSYFPCDVSIFEDDKVTEVVDEVGFIAEIILFRLLARIYAKEGYYCNWDERKSVSFTKRVLHNETDSATVDKVVLALIASGFFSKEHYERYGILTSSGIQKRWLNIMNRSRRSYNVIVDYIVSDSIRSEINKNATLMQHQCRVNAESMQHQCNINAESMQHQCNIDAESMQHSSPNKANKIKVKESKYIYSANSCVDETFITWMNTIVDAWNSVFSKPSKRYISSTMNINERAMSELERLYQQRDDFTISELTEAWGFLGLGTGYWKSWQFHSAVKPDNIRILLTSKRGETIDEFTNTYQTTEVRSGASGCTQKTSACVNNPEDSVSNHIGTEESRTADATQRGDDAVYGELSDVCSIESIQRYLDTQARDIPLRNNGGR